MNYALSDWHHQPMTLILSGKWSGGDDSGIVYSTSTTVHLGFYD